jgi:hypothetical protein
VGGSLQVNEGRALHLTERASGDDERELHKIKEVQTSSESDESGVYHVSTRIIPTDLDLQAGSPKSISRMEDSLSGGSDRRRSSGGSSRSSRSLENGSIQGGGYSFDGLSISSAQSSSRARGMAE